MKYYHFCLYLGTLVFIGECKKWGFNDVPVNDYMKKELGKGRWNIHRMVREVVDQNGWNGVKNDLVERAKKEPIIGVVYMVNDQLNKAVLEGMIDDCRNSIKPLHLEIICAPVYSFDWATAENNATSAWKTAAKFCNDIGIDKHVNVVNTCYPAHDRNYVGKDSLYFVKQILGPIKTLLPPPTYIKVNSLENGTGWDDSLSDDEPALRRRRTATIGVCAGTAQKI